MNVRDRYLPLTKAQLCWSIYASLTEKLGGKSSREIAQEVGRCYATVVKYLKILEGEGFVYTSHDPRDLRRVWYLPMGRARSRMEVIGGVIKCFTTSTDQSGLEESSDNLPQLD